MRKKITRRKFVKTSAALGGSAIIGSQFPGILKAGIPVESPDIVSVSGTDPMKAIPSLMEALGGIDRFVKTGNTVGFLLNSPWTQPGTYTNPDIALSVINLCLDAGAKEILCFKPVRDNYWEESRYFEDLKEKITKFKYCDERIEVEITGGVELKKASVFKGFLDVDVFINIPVAKHHAGTFFSGNLKNLMGISSSNTNRYMHSPDGEYTYDKHEYLAQCIADLNLLRKPDLSFMDALECVLENGPRGPGETISPGKIIAGLNPLVVDSYAVDIIGFDPDDILTHEKAFKHGLGETNLDKLTILEL